MLAREGLLPVLALVVLGTAAAYGLGLAWGIPLGVVGAGVAYLFRLPRPRQTDLPLAVVSPVTGVVDAVDQAYDPWFARVALRITIRLPFPGIAVLFSPADGKLVDYWTGLGAGGRPAPPGESREGWLAAWLGSPTRYTLGLVTDAGDPIAYTVSSRRSCSRVKLDRAPGERAVRARRSGFALFASRVDVLLPAATRADVQPGERLRAGACIIATLMHD